MLVRVIPHSPCWMQSHRAAVPLLLQPHSHGWHSGAHKLATMLASPTATTPTATLWGPYPHQAMPAGVQLLA